MTVVIPVTPGPRPNSKCSREYHVRLNEDQKKIIDGMGPGKPPDKILALINREALRQFPRDKNILKARWLTAVKEAKEWVAVSRKYEEILISEFECTRKELDDFEEESDATN